MGLRKEMNKSTTKEYKNLDELVEEFCKSNGCKAFDKYSRFTDFPSGIRNYWTFKYISQFQKLIK